MAGTVVATITYKVIDTMLIESVSINVYVQCCAQWPELSLRPSPIKKYHKATHIIAVPFAKRMDIVDSMGMTA